MYTIGFEIKLFMSYDTQKWVFNTQANNKDSDQPAHLCSLIRDSAFAALSMNPMETKV